ncbi:hypothetical protein EWP72_13325, partial [Neisseria meningitidis]|nr:hypothetical protein [Neisseria meningitidis]MBG8665848.1 hypothetical protein [Neisseria meningitidis]MBG8713608.1 hypothetical protein [Neisseria meningitidis]MBJ7835665.1 hypothetical protein [Neisseria meningitidis]
DVFGNHGLGGLLEEGAHEKSPKCLGGNLGDFGEFCKGLKPVCQGLMVSASCVAICCSSIRNLHHDRPIRSNYRIRGCFQSCQTLSVPRKMGLSILF